MSSLRKLFSLGALIPAVAATAGQPEPTYEGHPLSYWAAQIDPHTPTIIAINGVPVPGPPHETAIRHIGTNAIPTLLRWIAQRDPLGTSCLHPSPGERAEWCFGILGATARPAIPQLTALALKFPDRERYDRCIIVLKGIGPDAIPSLKQILTKGPDGKRFSVIESISIEGTNFVAPLLPGLIKCLTGKSEDLGWRAAQELSECSLPSQVLLSALTNALPSASTAARGRIFRCLYWSSYPATEATPILKEALADPDAQIRQEATWALGRIAPEVLPNKAQH